jgi:hypothetical protein
MKAYKTRFFTLLASCPIRPLMILPILLAAGLSLAAKAVDPDPDLVGREAMVQISKQLGVTCAYCHNPQNFRDGHMKTFQIAKEHMRVTATLNGPQGFNGKPKVDCYVCHQGKATVDYKLKL